MVFSRMVLAVDGSAPSERAVAVCAGLAAALGAEVTVIHVALDPVPRAVGGAAPGQRQRCGGAPRAVLGAHRALAGGTLRRPRGSGAAMDDH